MAVAAGVLKKHAYADTYKCSPTTASSSCARMMRANPAIMERVRFLETEAASKATDSMAGLAITKEFIEKELKENLDDAKSCPVKAIDGTVIGTRRDHKAVNQTLKLMAEVNGFTARAAAQKRREEDDEDVSLTVDQLVLKILAQMGAKGAIDAGARAAIECLGITATAQLGAGETAIPSARGLRSVSEAEVLP